MWKRPVGVVALKFLGLWGGSQTVPVAQNDKVGKDTDNKPAHKTSFKPRDIVNENHIGDYDYEYAQSASSDEVELKMLINGVPGLVVGVSRAGKTIWAEAFGYCDIENLVPCEVDSIMRIGSVSKAMFSASVVGPLIEKGKLSVDESIHKHLTLEEFPKKSYDNKEYDLTIKQLLSHTAGIPHYKQESKELPELKPIHPEGKLVLTSDMMANHEQFFSTKHYANVLEALEVFKDEPLVKKPGEYSYTSYGYTLLSAVMQKIVQRVEDEAGGKSKASETQIEHHWIRNLRKDWKMHDTHLDIHEYLVPRRARYYMRSGMDGFVINAPYQDSSVKWAGGGLLSNVGDMLKFGQALVDSFKGRPGAPLKRETVDLLWTEVKRDYALGFALYKEGGCLVVHHGGNSVGSSSVLVIYPEEELVVAIVGNLYSQNFFPLALKVAENFIGCSPQ